MSNCIPITRWLYAGGKPQGQQQRKFTPRDVRVGSEGGDLLKGRLEEVGESHAFRAVTALDSKSESLHSTLKPG